ncbi:MAG: iron complex transport system ATP-binding protein [Actinomycetota bacterium]|jgi:iron complex transport system ATP-binding protein|nr:iron complex transport system ATP-binding protein [Actinomycetota bacterium]
MDAVAIAGATVRISRRTILGPVDLRVGEHEQWVLLGPNGSGKTTLLKLAGARRQPSAGEVRIFGARVGRTDIRALHPRIGHVSHALADQLRPSILVLSAVLTGRDAALAEWMHDFDEADRSRALALLDQVGCADLADRTLGTCSMGERQRVLLARAMFGRHDLLLFDEPAAGLDLPARERLLAAMTTTAGGSVPASILATHHVEEIPSTVTHAGLLRDGMILTQGPIQEVLRAEPLRECFGLEIEIEHRGGRWSARATGP